MENIRISKFSPSRQCTTYLITGRKSPRAQGTVESNQRHSRRLSCRRLIPIWSTFFPSARWQFGLKRGGTVYGRSSSKGEEYQISATKTRKSAFGPMPSTWYVSGSSYTSTRNHPNDLSIYSRRVVSSTAVLRTSQIVHGLLNFQAFHDSPM